MKSAVFGIIALIVMTSCENHFAIEQEDFQEGWKKQDAFSYEFFVDEPTKDYDIFFVIRNTQDYPFRNIILFTQIDNTTDTVEYDLADKAGEWLGKGLGNTKELRLLYKSNFHFANKGKNTIQVKQAMRRDTLYGITDFGVIIDKKN